MKLKLFNAIIKFIFQFWSPYRLPESTGSLVDDSGENEKQRKVFTHEEYINLVLRTGQVCEIH